MEVFFACALGAFIGALIALQLNHNFWWVGLIAGFGIGYTTYEFKNFIAATSTAWRTASGLRLRPNIAFWKLYPQAFAATLSLLSSHLILVVLILMRSGKGFVTACLTGLAIVFIGSLATCGAFIEANNPERTRRELAALLRQNVIHICLWVVPKFVGRFLKQLFRATHSDIRLLCGVDAAIGAAIGYWFGNALVGALAGGLWGVLNFELFSIRILKLVPETQSLFRR